MLTHFVRCRGMVPGFISSTYHDIYANRSIGQKKWERKRRKTLNLCRQSSTVGAQNYYDRNYRIQFVINGKPDERKRKQHMIKNPRVGQFQSAFTRESDDEIPSKGTSPFTPMGEITVDPNGVLKLLNNLKIHKAPGPDCPSARVLKECSTEIAPILALILYEIRHFLISKHTLKSTFLLDLGLHVE